MESVIGILINSRVEDYETSATLATKFLEDVYQKLVSAFEKLNFQDLFCDKWNDFY